MRDLERLIREEREFRMKKSKDAWDTNVRDNYVRDDCGFYWGKDGGSTGLYKDHNGNWCSIP